MLSEAGIEKKRKSVAANYRRQGYRVVRPGNGETLPSFLQDCHPDLIAERDDDHVVIEIKPASTLKGSNDLQELAARVATQPGWRLELVTIGKEDDEADIVTNAGWLESMLRKPDLTANPGQAYMHVVYLGEVLEFLVRGVALRNGIKVRDKLARRIANELVFAGIWDESILDRVELALGYRDSLLYEAVALPVLAEQSAEMMTLCRDIHRQYIRNVDATTSSEG